MNLGAGSLLMVGAAAWLIGSSYLAYQLFLVDPMARPVVGTKGANRARACRSWRFRVIDCVLRRLAPWMELIPGKGLRRAIDRMLVTAGSPAGLCSNEFLAATCLCGVLLTVCGAATSFFVGLPAEIAALGLFVGLAAPWSRLTASSKSRARSLDLALPMAVDLASLCMGAGQDFPGSLSQIVNHAADPTAPIIVEFRTLLQQLDLGHSRRRALESLAERVPTDCVREFVNSVVQAEQKGNPLADVLAIQAQTQRLLRTLAAEELAAGAAVMLVGPMSLIFLCVILLMLSPLAIRFMSSGLAS